MAVLFLKSLQQSNDSSLQSLRMISILADFEVSSTLPQLRSYLDQLILHLKIPHGLSISPCAKKENTWSILLSNYPYQVCTGPTPVVVHAVQRKMRTQLHHPNITAGTENSDLQK